MEICKSKQLIRFSLSREGGATVRIVHLPVLHGKL